MKRNDDEHSPGSNDYGTECPWKRYFLVAPESTSPSGSIDILNINTSSKAVATEASGGIVGISGNPTSPELKRSFSESSEWAMPPARDKPLFPPEEENAASDEENPWEADFSSLKEEIQQLGHRMTRIEGFVDAWACRESWLGMAPTVNDNSFQEGCDFILHLFVD